MAPGNDDVWRRRQRLAEEALYLLVLIGPWIIFVSMLFWGPLSRCL